ncbi:F-box protein At1g67340-like [Carex rostrata]
MKRKVNTSIINMLPEDLIVEIVAQLVSHSSEPFVDLYNLKNTSKLFYAASKDEIVKERIALDREFPSLNWTVTDRGMSILNACAEAGNAEACFILALINIFDKEDISTGVDLLKKATCKGHTEALYLMNIVTLRFQEHHLLTAVNSDGVFGADEINFGHGDDQFELCREKVVNLIRHISWNKWQATLVGNRQQWCKNSECGTVRGWDRHRIFCSNACRWNHEYFALCREM